MSDLYTLTTPGATPVLLADVKTYLKQDSAADDTLIQILIDAAVAYGEAYTGREFRVQIFKLLIDAFSDRIVINRNPADAITTLKYTVGGVLTLIADSVYYLKQGVQCSEILLKEDQAWPTDLDEIEHGIEIIFTTAAYFQIDQIKLALYAHINHMYHNRGDCDINSSGKDSGADAIYNGFRISRV